MLNIIPNQRAGQIVTNAGLANDPTGRWSMVNPLNYASTAYPDIHILGDSQATGQPKSGHMANSQAKVCADAIIRAFNGEAPDPSPVTSSACFSPITATTASWLTASFQYDPVDQGDEARGSLLRRGAQADFGRHAADVPLGGQHLCGFVWLIPAPGLRCRNVRQGSRGSCAHSGQVQRARRGITANLRLANQ